MSTTVDDETILDVLRDSDEPGLTTTEVAAELPIARGTTRTRLQRLADADRLERERVGRSVVWWLTERAEEYEAAREAIVADAEATAGSEAAAEPEPDTEAEPEPELADNEIEVQATDSVGGATIEIDEPRVVTPTEEGDSRGPLRALVLLAVAVVGFALLRRLLGRRGE
jgi:hypothetical protein